MRNAQVFVAACVMLLGAVSFSQHEDKHPIDKAYDACMEKAMSTAEMRDCADEAYKKWDKEMNRAYKRLMEQLDDKGKAELKASQLKWIEYRDLETKLMDRVYSRLQGTMYIPMRAYSSVRLVKDRALTLGSYLDLLDEKGD